MAQAKAKYIVKHISGQRYETLAVSPQDAINNIHYNLWFGSRIWTEMCDFKAEPEIAIKARELLRKAETEKSEKYHQMSLFEVIG